MQKIVATGSLMLLLGLTTQAHAGEYVLQNNGWTLISATAPTSTVTSTGEGVKQESSDTQQTSLRWQWAPNKATDNPTPVQIRLNFSATVGDCSVYAPELMAYAFTDVYAGFANGGPSTHFRNFAEDQGGMPYTEPGSTSTGGVTKPYNGAQIIFDTVEISASTSAYALGPGDTSTANTTTGKLTSFALEAR